MSEERQLRILRSVKETTEEASDYAVGGIRGFWQGIPDWARGLVTLFVVFGAIVTVALLALFAL